MRDIPSVGDLVQVTYENDYDNEEEIDGRVTDVDTHADGIPEVEKMFTIDEGQPNRVVNVHVREDGTAGVTRYSEFSGSHFLGDDAEWEVLN